MAEHKDTQLSPEEPGSEFVERRRPERVEYNSPDLIKILRQEALHDQSPEREILDWHDDLRPALGIARGVCLSLVLWAVLGWAIWRIFA